MLLYKFFFFNYVLQVTEPELMESMISGETENPLKQYASEIPPIMKPHEQNAKQQLRTQQTSEDAVKANIQASKLATENAGTLSQLVQALMVVLTTLPTRRENSRFDQALKPLKLGGMAKSG